MNLANSSQLPYSFRQTCRPNFIWADIETVFLDMDGTLLDKYFDDYFWEQYVPENYAKKHNLTHSEAHQHLLGTYKSVENTLQWTDLDYWSERLGLDIAQLKKEISHLVNIHPDVVDFLAYMENLGKKVYMVTNAHPKALQVKMDRVNIANWFQRLICSQEVGAAKEQPTFWHKLHDLLPYDKETTLFADDTEKVLHSAAGYGIQHLIHVAKPSSRLDPKHSLSFPSILSFRELMF
ncbi:MAG: GMP/IMP nucleotidase [Proteobacteria bacterium]|nr:GMP/IMP nucleotidase [Pseudomonadota bacterium]